MESGWRLRRVSLPPMDYKNDSAKMLAKVEVGDVLVDEFGVRVQSCPQKQCFDGLRFFRGYSFAAKSKPGIEHALSMAGGWHPSFLHIHTGIIIGSMGDGDSIANYFKEAKAAGRYEVGFHQAFGELAGGPKLLRYIRVSRHRRGLIRAFPDSRRLPAMVR